MRCGFRSMMPHTPALHGERPTYGEHRKPTFTPRITARRLMAKFIWRPNSFAPYRIMMLRRLWKPIR